MKFDMNRAWDDALSLVRKNFQLLAVIAGVFLLLPSILFYLAFPDFAEMTAVEPGAELSNDQAWAFLARFLPAMLLMFLIQFVGSLAMIVLIGGERPTVGEAISRAVRGVPTLLATGISIFVLGTLGILLLSIAVTLIVAVLALVLGDGAIAVLAFLVYLVLVPAVFYFYVRISVVLPVIALERERGFVRPLKRAWKLTAPVSRRLFAFFALLFVAYVVISLLLLLVMQGFGLLTPDVMSGGAVFALGLVSSVIGALVAMLFTGILVAVYRQLAGGSPAAREYEADV